MMFLEKTSPPLLIQAFLLSEAVIHYVYVNDSQQISVVFTPAPTQGGGQTQVR